MKGFFKSAFGSIFAVVIFFVTVSYFSVTRTREMIVTQAEEAVRNLVKATTGKIDRLMSAVETAVASQAWIINERIADPDYMYRITDELVDNHSFICGSTVAFKSNFYSTKGHFWAPYTYRNEHGKLESFQLGNVSNDYFTQDWYCRPLQENRPMWSEPYFDVGGGKVWMSTYSMPIRDQSGEICAIFTADLSLQQLMDYVSKVRPYENSYVIMKAGDHVLVGAEEEKAKRSGAYVGKVLNVEDRADNGWTVEIGCPIKEIMKAPQKVVNRIVVFSALGLALILGLSIFYTSRLQKSTAMRERMASELSTAWIIQSGILPKDFPANIHAFLRPAREVGGDLYDFVRQDDIIYFIVGDASGKGVPAALFSFMAGTVFRMCCSLGLSPDEICARINEALARNNEMSMFVTAFVGALNTRTGELLFGCAGHNPPALVTPSGEARFLSVHRSAPAGALDGVVYRLQKTLIPAGSKIVVYTDGIVEAERTDHTQYGEQRFLACLGGCGGLDAQATSRKVIADVDRFVKGAEQSDDITILTIELPFFMI